MDKSKVKRAAEALAAAWRGGRPIVSLPEGCQPQSMDEAYAIQEELNRLLGYPVAGWKLGHSSPAALRRAKLSAPPTGRLYAHTVKESPARFAAGTLHAPKLEPEFAFRLSRDLPPRAAAYDRAEVERAVGGLHLALEIADSRFADPAAVGIPTATADNMNSGVFILGAALADWRGLDLRAVPVALKVDGRTVAQEAERDVRCDPMEALVIAVNDLSRRGSALGAGHIVTTGSHTTPQPVKAAGEMVADFGSLGEVGATLEG